MRRNLRALCRGENAQPILLLPTCSQILRQPYRLRMPRHCKLVVSAHSARPSAGTKDPRSSRGDLDLASRQRDDLPLCRDLPRTLQLFCVGVDSSPHALVAEHQHAVCQPAGNAPTPAGGVTQSTRESRLTRRSNADYHDTRIRRPAVVDSCENRSRIAEAALRHAPRPQEDLSTTPCSATTAGKNASAGVSRNIPQPAAFGAHHRLPRSSRGYAVGAAGRLATHLAARIVGGLREQPTVIGRWWCFMRKAQWMATHNRESTGSRHREPRCDVALPHADTLAAARPRSAPELPRALEVHHALGVGEHACRACSPQAMPMMVVLLQFISSSPPFSLLSV